MVTAVDGSGWERRLQSTAVIGVGGGCSDLLHYTLAARGLEEGQNFEELLTESVDRVHFS
jgi:hypothetical protein